MNENTKINTQQLKSDISIAEVAHRLNVKLNRQLQGDCPSGHISKGHKCFSINAKRGYYHCFHCNISGDVISLVGLILGKDFKESVAWLKDNFGYNGYKRQLKPAEIDDTKELYEKDALYELVFQFGKTLLFQDDGEEALKYLTINRQYSFNELKQTDWIYFPNEKIIREHLLSIIPESKEQIKNLSLQGAYGDRLALAFPYRNRNGLITGFVKRATIPEGIEIDGSLVRYDSTKGLSKYDLFNLHNCKGQKEVLVVEGYPEALYFPALGIANIAAIGAGILTKSHIEGLKEFGIKSAIVCLDNDEAGIRNTPPALQLLRENGIEAIAISAEKLSPHKDPDEYVKANGIEAFSKLIESIKTPIGVSEIQKRYLTRKEAFPKISSLLCNKYMELMSDVSEAPHSYHCFCLLTVLGTMLNRNVHIQWGFDRIYPNIWAMIVGQTGRARKSSTINKAKNMFEEVSPEFQTLLSLSTWEGLLYAMQRKNDETGRKPEITMVCMSEFDGFLKKSRQESIAHLIPQLCDLYDCPQKVQNTTISKPLVINNPFLTIIAGIQPEVLEESFQKGDVHGGFAGRFMYILDDSDKEIPMPKWDKQQAFNNIKMELNRLKHDFDTPCEIKIDTDCHEVWNSFYHEYRNEEGLPSLLLKLNDRMQNHVLKIAMLFAIIDGQKNISLTYLKEAIEIGKWLMENNKRLFGMLESSESRKLEEKILELITNGMTNKRQIYQSLSGRISARDLEYAIVGLQKYGIIREKISKNPRGSPTKNLYIVDEN